MLRNPKLSIIIPCYNCEKTLKRSFDSCWEQNIDFQWEIIMIDDGSRDKTKILMNKLAEGHNNVKLLYHEKNRGGGATRNTGIKNCSGNIIFCLDSDNILPPNTLNKMAHFLIKNELDGTLFYERRFFQHDDTKNYYSHFNKIVDKPILLKNLFDQSDTILDNFLYTKESYLKTSGYPENHGFDTQCFEVRYLSKNNKVFVCKDTYFLHRQARKGDSYFEREYNKGNFSKNYYLILEEIIELFSEKALGEIINYDIFLKSSMKENILNEIKRMSLNGELFGENKKYIIFVDAVKKYRENKYADAIALYHQMLISGFKSKVLYYNILRNTVGLSEKKETIESETDKLISGMANKKERFYKTYHKIAILNKIIILLRKWKIIGKK